MALDLTAINHALTSHAAASGYFEYVNAAPTGAAPGSGVAWDMYLGRIRPYPAGSGLDSVTVVVAQTITIGLADPPAEPRESVDPAVAAAADAILRAYAGDFTLGGLIRNVDIFGAAGAGLLEGNAGWAIPPEGVRRRVMVINLPLVINDLWTEAP